MTREDYKTVLYRQDDGFWIAEIPATPGCNPLMDLAESAKVFGINASRHGVRFSVGPSSWIQSQPHDG